MRVQDLYAVGNLEAGQSSPAQAGKTHPAEPAGLTGDRQAGAPAGAAASDRVELSDLMGALARTLSAEHPDRAARLERLASLVETGRYRIDAPAVSRRLVDETLRGG